MIYVKDFGIAVQINHVQINKRLEDLFHKPIVIGVTNLRALQYQLLGYISARIENVKITKTFKSILWEK